MVLQVCGFHPLENILLMEIVSNPSLSWGSGFNVRICGLYHLNVANLE